MTGRIVLTGGMSTSAMSAMSAVAEQVHERTGEEQEVCHAAEHVGTMLGEQKIGGDGAEDHKSHSAS